MHNAVTRQMHQPHSHSDIVRRWSMIVNDWLLPFDLGITSLDIDKTFSHPDPGGRLVIF